MRLILGRAGTPAQAQTCRLERMKGPSPRTARDTEDAVNRRRACTARIMGQPQQRPVVVLQSAPCSPCQSLVSCALVGSFERCSGGFQKNPPGEVLLTSRGCPCSTLGVVLVMSDVFGQAINGLKSVRHISNSKRWPSSSVLSVAITVIPSLSRNWQSAITAPNRRFSRVGPKNKLPIPPSSISDTVRFSTDSFRPAAESSQEISGTSASAIFRIRRPT